METGHNWVRTGGNKERVKIDYRFVKHRAETCNNKLYNNCPDISHVSPYRDRSTVTRGRHSTSAIKNNKKSPAVTTRSHTSTHVRNNFRSTIKSSVNTHSRRCLFWPTCADKKNSSHMSDTTEQYKQSVKQAPTHNSHYDTLVPRIRIHTSNSQCQQHWLNASVSTQTQLQQTLPPVLHRGYRHIHTASAEKDTHQQIQIKQTVLGNSGHVEQHRKSPLSTSAYTAQTGPCWSAEHWMTPQLQPQQALSTYRVSARMDSRQLRANTMRSSIINSWDPTYNGSNKGRFSQHDMVYIHNVGYVSTDLQHMTWNKRHRQHQQVSQHHSGKQRGSACQAWLLAMARKWWLTADGKHRWCLCSTWHTEAVHQAQWQTADIQSHQFQQGNAITTLPHVKHEFLWQHNQNEWSHLKTAGLVATENGRSARQQTQENSQTWKLSAPTVEAIQEGTAAPEWQKHQHDGQG